MRIRLEYPSPREVALYQAPELCKAELIHRRARWKTNESVELATLEWVSWFNQHRVLAPIAYIQPAETEANRYRQLASHVTRW